MARQKKKTEDIVEETVADIEIMSGEDIGLDFSISETADPVISEDKVPDIPPEEIDPSAQIDVKTENEITKESESLAASLSSSIFTFLKDTYEIETGDSVKCKIPTGIDLLDAVLGGGFGTGLVQIISPSGSGKSSLAAKVCSTGQKLWPGQFMSVYIDTEDTTTSQRLVQLGVKHPPINPINGSSVEKVFKVVEGLCVYKDEHPQYLDIPWVVVWDSLANTLTEAGEEEDDPTALTGQKARILSHMLPKYVKKLNKYNICLIAVNQLRSKITFGPVKQVNDLKFLPNDSVPGGKASIYNSMQILYFKPNGEVDGEYGFTGLKLRGKMVKNKLFTPNIEFGMVMSFARGFSNFFTNYELLKEYKRINAGAWCKLIAMPEKKFRQFEALKLYSSNKEFKEVFDSEVKDVITKNIIEKYTVSEDSI